MELKVLPFQDLEPIELYQILKLRQDVFVLEQTCLYADMDGKDQSSWHMFVEEDGIIGSYIRLLPPGLSYPEYASIGRVATITDYRGQGLSSKLLEKGIAFLKQKFPNSKIKISAQSHLLAFYNRLGFQAVGEEYLEDDIPHRAMVLE